MRKIQDKNHSFRLSHRLKEQLNNFCEQNDFHTASVIRMALDEYLRKVTSGTRETNAGGWAR